jgi:hypothetical protein
MWGLIRLYRAHAHQWTEVTAIQCPVRQLHGLQTKMMTDSLKSDGEELKISDKCMK